MASLSPRWHYVRRSAAAAEPWLAVALGMAVATHSVVRYELPIVLIYAALAALLTFWVAAGRSAAPAAAQPLAWTLAGVLGVAAVLDVLVRPYTYLTSGQGWAVRWVMASSTALAALLLFAAGRWLIPPWLVLATAATGYLVAAVLLIHFDPRPKIDVWVTLQQAADGIAHGRNIYTLNWHDSPGVQDSFTYLPFTALLLAPGRWLGGDVRWALVAITVIGAVLVYLLGCGRESSQTTRITAAAASALLLLMPGTATQVEQAWTEPLLMTCLAGWALGVRRGWTVLPVISLALGLASKQHLVLLLPMLAAWPRFGWRRALGSTVLAGIFVMPWLVASPPDMVHDTVTVLVDFQPLRFADTLYIAAMHELGWTPPFWITGAIIALTTVMAAVLVRARNPDLATVLRWAALILFTANLVNKQAFYNQYWLVAALVVMSLACPVPPRPAGLTAEPARPPAVASA